MNNNGTSQELLDRIDSYLLHRMNEQERVSFENRMATDIGLSREVQLQKELIHAIELGALQESLEEIRHQNLDRVEESNSTESNRYWYAMAASLLALMTLGVWMFSKPDPKEKLFSEYVDYDPGLPVPMSASGQYSFYDAMVDYKNELYTSAIGKWSVLLEDDPQNDTLNYYLASAHFRLEEYSRAIPLYLKVAMSESPEFQAKSEWYLALSWIHTGEFEKIDSLAGSSQHHFSGKIREINQKLKEQR